MSGPRDLDVTHLPTYGFGTRSPMAWGTLGFIAIETTGFALAIGTYFYLWTLSDQWPLDARPPDLGPGTVLTLVLLASLVPNFFLKRAARRQQLIEVRLGMVLMSLLGLLPLFIRISEFPALNVSWDANAYGSAVWLLLGLHTTHLLTDVGDTLVLAILMFTRHGLAGRRFSDVEDNAVYWDFVVVSWLPIYAVIYWMPRW